MTTQVARQLTSDNAAQRGFRNMTTSMTIRNEMTAKPNTVRS